VDEVIADPGVDGVGSDRDGGNLIVAGAGDEPVSSAMDEVAKRRADDIGHDDLPLSVPRACTAACRSF